MAAQEGKHNGKPGMLQLPGIENLNSGEGGAILTNDQGLYEYCLSFHNQGRGRYNSGFGYVRNGGNFRMTEFQGALLLQQLTRLEAQSRLRTQNAEYLTKQLKEIPGNYAGAHVRRLHQKRLSPLYVSL